jgi:hypothetical protein
MVWGTASWRKNPLILESLDVAGAFMRLVAKALGLAQNLRY